ncbi:hypothetical protein F4803DRAFT_552595 [Xylaria telfairii]|nr:hypothetical protein F4803DRAFT_552595 [Xylaria telfairii]
MIRIDALSLLLLVALPIPSSGFKLNGLDTFRDFDLIAHATTQGITAEKVNERQSIKKEASLAQDSHPLVPSPLISVKPNHLQRERSGKSEEEVACGLHPRDHLCGNILFPHASELSSSVSSSVSSAVSNSVSSSDASVLTASLLVAVQSASEEGFQNGQSKASESVQSAIDSAKASVSSIVESAFSAVRSTQSARETIPSIMGDSNRTSHSLIIDKSQLAGIVLGVFFASSVLSVLTTLFFLWYRKRKTATAHNIRHFPTEEKRKMIWPTLGKLRGNFFTSSSAANKPAGHRDLSKIFPPGLKHVSPSQSQHGMPSANRIPFTSPISPSSNSDQIFPVSPMSDQPPDSAGRDSSPSFRLGLYGNRTQMSSGSEASDVTPMGLSPTSNSIQNGSQQIPIMRIGGQETNRDRLASNMWTTQTFPPNERPITFTDIYERPDMRDAANRMEAGIAAIDPIMDRRSLSPPIIPLRFSSLNAQKGHPIRNSTSFNGNDGTFFLSTDEESADRDPEFSQDQSGLRSPSHSSVISQDLTQFDPGGPALQPTSRFSMSPAPPSSLGYSASSSSPVPQQERPEINPLRPAPSSPPQLQSPVPRRLNAIASLASLEPAVHGDS